jgi:hypothetical protein
MCIDDAAKRARPRAKISPGFRKKPADIAAVTVVEITFVREGDLSMRSVVAFTDFADFADFALPAAALAVTSARVVGDEHDNPALRHIHRSARVGVPEIFHGAIAHRGNGGGNGRDTPIARPPAAGAGTRAAGGGGGANESPTCAGRGVPVACRDQRPNGRTRLSVRDTHV